MGANQYTPSTEAVRAIFSHHRDAGMEAYNTGLFDCWLAQIRTEAKVEALKEAATALREIDPSYDGSIFIRAESRHVYTDDWLRERAEQIWSTP